MVKCIQSGVDLDARKGTVGAQMVALFQCTAWSRGSLCAQVSSQTHRRPRSEPEADPTPIRPAQDLVRAAEAARGNSSSEDSPIENVESEDTDRPAKLCGLLRPKFRTVDLEWVDRRARARAPSCAPPRARGPRFRGPQRPGALRGSTNCVATPCSVMIHGLRPCHGMWRGYIVGCGVPPHSGDATTQ